SRRENRPGRRPAWLSDRAHSFGGGFYIFGFMLGDSFPRPGPQAIDRVGRRIACEGSQTRKSGARKPPRGPPHCVVVGSLGWVDPARSLRRRSSSAGYMRRQSLIRALTAGAQPERSTNPCSYLRWFLL